MSKKTFTFVFALPILFCKIMKKFLLTLIYALLILNLSAQITTGSLTQSRFAYLHATQEYIDITIPPSSKSERPENCIGRLANCDRSFFNNAEKYDVEGGTLWRIGVSAKDAGSVGVEFKDITIAKGVELCLYGGSDFLGLITDTVNNFDNKLRTRYIDNDSITIELFVPQDVNQSDFIISKIAYGFYPISKMLKVRVSGKCKQPDINGEYGLNYQVEKHAVVQYQFDSEDYTYVCTGTLVNNTEFDATPYIITAAHCVCKQEDAETVVTYFNFELDADGISPKGFQTLSGADLVAFPPKTHRKDMRDYEGLRITEGDYNDYDISLLKLSAIPPKEYYPYYLGLSLDTKNNLNKVVTIHHPSGNEKAIAISDMPPYQDSYPVSDEIFIENAHWHIDTWHQGYTEVGSSGAPLINQDKKLIGVLSGGLATCQEPYDDFFQMVSKFWNTNLNPNHQLAYWLANGKEINQIESFDPYGNFSSISVPWLSGEWNHDSTAITLNWQTDGVPTLFKLYCNGDVIKEINYGESDSYTFSNISPKSTYTFYIESIFNATSQSSRSNGVVLSNFTTPLPEPDPITAVKNITEQVDAKIYPNPAKNSINILLPPNLGKCTISLSSVSGKILKTINTEISAGNPVSVDLTNIKSGIYIICITSASTTFSQKIVVE